MKQFNIYLAGKLYDTVYFDSSFTNADVYNTLVNHDNYHPEITVSG